MAEARAENQMPNEMQMQNLQQQGPGKTVIADTVVAKIAGMAAREVPGVHALGGTTERAISGALSRISGAQRMTGIDVQVGQQEAAVDLSMIVDYGQSIPDVTQNVRQNVCSQIESLTGLRCKEVNITVSDVYMPQEEQQQQQQQQQQQGESESRVA
ncbi:MAG: Asp23/Gls24 family envelope stress response protein [Candidatus Aquicultor sp.]